MSFNVREEYLFQKRDFVGHSGDTLTWKIECDAIQDVEWATLAHIIHEIEPRPFGEVVGIPRGGLKLSKPLEEYATGNDEDPLLIVDDVMTTGGSFDYFAEQYFRNRQYRQFFGWCIFNRGCDTAPAWVTSLFTMPYHSKEFGYIKSVGIGDGGGNYLGREPIKISEERQKKMKEEDKQYWINKWNEVQGKHHT